MLKLYWNEMSSNWWSVEAICGSLWNLC